MSARATITGNIRRALGQTGDDAGRAAAVAERLRQRPTGVIPARGQLPHEEQISLCMTMAEGAAATTERLEERGDRCGARVQPGRFEDQTERIVQVPKAELEELQRQEKRPARRIFRSARSPLR